PAQSAQRDPLVRRLRAVPHVHDGEPAEAARRRSAVLPGQTRLADGVRLPDESARPVPRRLARAPGSLSRRGRAARLSSAARRHADQLPRPRRARGWALAEWAPQHRRRREAGVLRLLAPARAGLAARLDDRPVGPGPAGVGKAYVPPRAAR